jgi:hypothetical protein
MASLLTSLSLKEREVANDTLVRAGARSKPILKDLARSQGPAAIRARRIVFAIDHPVGQVGKTLRSFRNSNESWRIFLWQADLHVGDICRGRSLPVIKDAFAAFGFKVLESSKQMDIIEHRWCFASEKWGENGLIPVEFVISINTREGDSSNEVLYTEVSALLTVNRPFVELTKDAKISSDEIFSEILRHGDIVKISEECPVVETISFHMSIFARGLPRGEVSPSPIPAGIRCDIVFTNTEGLLCATKGMIGMWGSGSWDDWDVSEPIEALRKHDRMWGLAGWGSSGWPAR